MEIDSNKIEEKMFLIEEQNLSEMQVEDGEKQKELISFSVFETIKQCQQQNGLRHNDYMRYRQYCTRRLRRLRVSLHLTCGRKKFEKNDLKVEDITSFRHLLLPLFNAERCQAYSMQLKHELDSDTGEENLRRRFHLIRLLKRAFYWSKQFKEFCSSVASSRTILEAEAYFLQMDGSISLEREIWEKALNRFVQSKNVFEKLQLLALNTQERKTFLERIHSIEPSIKYCKYVVDSIRDATKNMNIENKTSSQEHLMDTEYLDEILKSKIENALLEKRQQKAQALLHVDQYGWKLPVHDDRVRLSILRIREFVEKQKALNCSIEGKNVSKQIQIFSDIVSSCDDSLRIVVKDLESVLSLKNQLNGNQGKINKSTKIEHYEDNDQEHLRALFRLRIYFNYTKISAVIGRNTSLVDYYENQYNCKHSKQFFSSFNNGENDDKKNNQNYIDKQENEDEFKLQQQSFFKKHVKPLDILVIYDKILGNLDMFEEQVIRRLSLLLSKVSNEVKKNESDAVFEEFLEKLKCEIDLKRKAFNALRCYQIAESFISSESNQQNFLIKKEDKEKFTNYLKALALFRRTQERCEETLLKFKQFSQIKNSQYQDSDFSIKPNFSQKLEKLKEHAILKATIIHARALIAQKQNQNFENSLSKKNFDSLIEFEQNQVIDEEFKLNYFPPEFLPVPCKPIFFDLAYDFIQFRDLSNRCKPKPKLGVGSVLGFFGLGGKKEGNDMVEQLQRLDLQLNMKLNFLVQ